MLPEIVEIKKRRKILGLTQPQLAKLAEVSQSLIAKIETNKVNPSYNHAKKIFEVLEQEEGKQTKTKQAKDIHNTPITFINKSDTIIKAAQIMKKNEYSQLPIDDERKEVVGSISEEAIRNYMARGENLEKLTNMQVCDLMFAAFPQVDENYPINSILPLLQYSQAVLTTRKGKVVGIITKSDLFKLFT
jgi:predicted transcriptional regulator